MKYLHLILIILGLLSGGYTSTAQESQFSVIYDFHVHNREELQDGKIKIEVFKGGLNTFFGVALDHIEMDIQDSITRVEVPIPEKINYLRLGVFFGRLEGAYSLINLNVNNNLFLVEDSDTVEIHLYPKEISDVVFRGHYAQKYDLQYTLSNQRNISNGINETYLSILKQKRYDEAFSFWLSRAEHQAKKLNDKVDSSAINPVIKRIFKYDNLASLYNAYRTILEGALEVLPYDQNMTEIAKRKLTEPFQKLNDNDDEWKAWSMLWCDMLLFKERLLWLIKNHPAQVADVTVYDGCIADIAKKYRGSIRDKLFYLALLRKWDNAGLRNIGEPLMGDNIYSNAYKSLRIRSDGGKVFDAVFMTKTIMNAGFLNLKEKYW